MLLAALVLYFCTSSLRRVLHVQALAGLHVWSSFSVVAPFSTFPLCLLLFGFVIALCSSALLDVELVQ